MKMKRLKNLLTCLLAGTMLFALAACGQQAAQPPAASGQSQPSSSMEETQPSSGSESLVDPSSSEESPSSSGSGAAQTPSGSSAASLEPASSEQEPAEPEQTQSEGGKTLVVYFSASGNTEAVAEAIAETLDADIYELVPEQPYTDADLNWNDPDSRVNAEHENPDFRTAIAGDAMDLSGYDTIFIGYPLWWRQAPSIVWNFVENSDLAGKTMIPFCTSMSDGFGSSGDTLAGMAPDANWLAGQRYGEALDADAVTQWVSSLNLSA